MMMRAQISLNNITTLNSKTSRPCCFIYLYRRSEVFSALVMLINSSEIRSKKSIQSVSVRVYLSFCLNNISFIKPYILESNPAIM